MRNEGTIDRVLRGTAGLILLALAFLSGLALFEAGWAFWAAMLVGAILIVTAITGFCPAYRLLGLKTCEEC
ncbi:DUF2892 domain-containing protein [Roseobacter sp. HKCCA0434]|uniref:YgaP family membrane protein n=1 Tax=Roseobacter sp. HKCCA0434 TaxID=3079297 RepID=UPI002905E0BC|nr:DUF2892 domain-containing protein [Roseobacter sp. HKCCA0434]